MKQGLHVADYRKAIGEAKGYLETVYGSHMIAYEV